MRNCTIGIVGGVPGLDDEARRQLAELGTVCDIVPPSDGAAAWHVDVLLTPISVVAERGVQFFAQAHRANPRSRLLVVASRSDLPLAAELLHCGAIDVAEAPVHRDEFVARVRALLAVEPPSAFHGPAVVAAPSPPFAGRNMRRCVRATIPPERPLLVALRGADAMAAGEDMSVPVSDAPGGLLLRVNEPAAAALPLDAWCRGESAPLSLRIGAGLLTIDAHLVREASPAAPGWRRYALMYRARTAADVARLARYWVDLQLLPPA